MSKFLYFVHSVVYTAAAAYYLYLAFRGIDFFPNGIAVSRVLTIIYAILWMVSLYAAIRCTRILYGDFQHVGAGYISVLVALSVTMCILGFALCYLAASYDDHTAFNLNGSPSTLTPASALYFSLLTFATVGYGDFAPANDTMRLFVSAEIVASMFYTILVFSVAGGVIRQKIVEDRQRPA
jgi:voltage-gated potassium channel